MPTRSSQLSPEDRDAVVEFLREWLPTQAKEVYREMIRLDPDNWSRDAHFAEGVIVDSALRGNGFDEASLGVADLDSLWPELLRLAVEGDGG